MSTNRRRLGKYELRELLGQGGMAEVWKAFDTHLQRYVAVKLLHANLRNDPDFMKRFEREARVVAGLHHRNIVQIHDFQISYPPESESIIAYMVMEYIEGQTLTDYIHSTSRLGKFPSSADIIHLFAPISSAIDYAHQQGMIHRDIKPANILLDQRNQLHYQMGEPILTDFGIVKLLGSSTGTLSGGWLGTPVYISPEQAQGKPGNERSDIYSLGVILYEICTGVRPFQGDNPIVIMMQHISVMPTAPDLINPKIPVALTEVILRSLAKDPEARFSSASALTVALAEALNMPVPAKLSRPAYSLGGASDPTFEYPPQPSFPVAITPSLPATALNGATHPYIAAPPTPQFVVPANDALNTPTTPLGASLHFHKGTIAGSFPMGNSGQGTQGLMAANATTPLPPKLAPPLMRGRSRWNVRLALLAVVVFLLLASSGVGLFFWLSHTRPATPTMVNVVVGNAAFVSSGLLDVNSAQGINDQLRINLSKIPTPAAGKSYYAWLLSDKTCDTHSINGNLQCDPNDPKQERILNPVAPILLGRLSLNNGNVHLFYPGDQQHSNLIGTMSRFLITEENTNSTPKSPSLDQRTWSYYAELPQIPYVAEHHGKAIDTLRVLLYEDEVLVALGIHGGSDIHFYINTQKIFEWADSARDAQISKNLVTLRQQVVRILAYLDGESYVKADVPPTTPLQVDATLASIPLIDLQKNNVIRSYIHSINDNLGALANENGVTPEMRQLVMQADDALTGNVELWLQQVHSDAKQLFKMTDSQLESSSAQSTMDDMVTQATYAYNGKVDPSTGKLLEGVAQIHADIQQLVIFDIKPYSQS